MIHLSEGHSAKGFYSMHLNALYDLHKHTYPAALIQPVHYKDEFRAFCDMVDRLHTPPGTRDVFIGDRGYCTYNNMAHVMEKGQYFLFRTKDIHSKGLVGNFDFPDSDSFDITVNVTLVRSHNKPEYIKREIWAKLITYNMTEALVNLTVIKHGQTKHVYKVNFSMAAHICRAFLRLATEEDPIDVMSLLRKELIPIRKERQYPRLQTAHFRKPRYFIYRAA
ncbi:transposase [Enterocloster clostridioformis]